VPTVSKSVILDLLEPSGPVQACARIAPLLQTKIHLKNMEFYSHTVSPSTKLAYGFFYIELSIWDCCLNQILPDLRSSYSVRSGTSRILGKSELSVHVVDYLCIHKGVRLKSKLQNPGIRSVTTSPPCRVCYRPTVFFRHFRLIGLSFPQWKIRRVFNMFQFCFFFFSTEWLEKLLYICRGVPVCDSDRVEQGSNIQL